MNDTNVKRVAHKAKRWLKDQIVEDVPDRLALCEFGCCACHAPSQLVAKWPRRMLSHPARPIAELHEGGGPM